MKKIIYHLLIALSFVTLSTSCSKDDEPDLNTENTNQIEFEENRKILVTYFSATGTTQRLAERIASATDADLFRIEAAEPYASNPYDDSDRIQNESYSDLRPTVKSFPDNLEDYDVIFVGSPIWWHNPAMVICTFLENYDLNDKIIVPFFTYGATTYLQQSVDKIYEVTPASIHLPTYTGGNLETWLHNINILKQ